MWSPLRRLWNVVRRSRLDDDLRDEFETHLALIEDEERARGVDARQARDNARVRFGNPFAYREQSLDGVVARWLDDAWKDARFALTHLRRAPGFTVVAVLSLALGLGANAAIFTLIDAVLLKSLPVRDPAALVLVGHARARGVGTAQRGSIDVVSYDLYTHLRDTDVFDRVCAVQSSEDRVAVRLGDARTAEPATARFVSGNYFHVLGADAALGRTLTPTDDAPASRPAAVVSFRYWKNTLNQNPAAIGSTIDINGVPVTIVGVAPAEFYGETIEPDPPGFWLPIAASRTLNRQRNLIDNPDEHWLYLIGRLKPDTATGQAQARLTLALQNWLRGRAGSPISP